MKLTAPCGALVRLKLETKPLTRAERFELESELDDLRRQRLREEAEDRAARQARERGSGNYRY
jgi:transcription elongation GreA/GreB family factor